MIIVAPPDEPRTPDAADLKAYDELLEGASRLTVHDTETMTCIKALTVGSRSQDKFRIDVDGTPSALSVWVCFDRARPDARVIELPDESPRNAYFADILLGDGSDGRLVQTISCAGSTSQRWCDDTLPSSQSMDRGDTLQLDRDEGNGCVSTWSFLIKCAAPVTTMSVTSQDKLRTRLVATPALNKATCKRQWLDCLLCPVSCFTPCVLPLIASTMCCAYPPVNYEARNGELEALDGVQYVVPSLTTSCSGKHECVQHAPCRRPIASLPCFAHPAAWRGV